MTVVRPDAALPTRASAPARHRVRRSSLLVIPGLLVGWLWLAPVFALPGSDQLYTRGFAAERFLRVLSVSLLLPIVAGRLPRVLRHEGALRAALVAFVVLPLLSVVNFPDASHLVATVGPFLVGGTSLVCLAALRPAEFRRWLQGVGCAALGFVAVGLARYGLESTTYYGRPRVHLGFSHPTQTASALCAAALFVGTLIAARHGRRAGLVRRVALAALVVASGYVLVLVSSRNTFLLLCLSVLFTLTARVVRRPVPRFALLLALLALFPAIMFYAARGDIASPVWQIANVASSLRLVIYRDILLGFTREDTFSLLFGPTYTVRELKSTLSGFAASDSTYLTILLNYGAITTAAFYGFWITVGARLSARTASAPFGVFCAISVYLLLDAQGVTPSNVLVFALLAWCVRSALRADGPSATPRGRAPRARPAPACA